MEAPLAEVALFASVLTNMALALILATFVAGRQRVTTNVGGRAAVGGRELIPSGAASRRSVIVELTRRRLPPRTIAAVTGASRGEIEVALKLAGMKKRAQKRA